MFKEKEYIRVRHGESIAFIALRGNLLGGGIEKSRGRSGIGGDTVVFLEDSRRSQFFGVL